MLDVSVQRPKYKKTCVFSLFLFFFLFLLVITFVIINTGGTRTVGMVRGPGIPEVGAFSRYLYDLIFLAVGWPT